MIGLIPAAGHATRINGLPKFLLPLPGDTYLLDVLRRRMAAHTSSLIIGVNSRNAHLIDRYAQHYAYIHECNTATMSETLLSMRSFCGNRDILFGMPDSYWFDDIAYPRLAHDINDGAMVSVALFEARPEQRAHIGMCDVRFEDDELFVTQVVDKPGETKLHLAWGAMAWCAGFWQYVKPGDPHVGYGVQRALDAGVKVRGYLAYGGYYDCGTPDGYFDLVETLRERAL